MELRAGAELAIGLLCVLCVLCGEMRSQTKPTHATRYIAWNVIGCAGDDIYALASDWDDGRRLMTWVITAKLPHGPMKPAAIACADQQKGARVYLRVVYPINPEPYPPSNGALYFNEEQIHVRSSVVIGHQWKRAEAPAIKEQTRA